MDEREVRTGRSETGNSVEWINEDGSNSEAEEHERVDRGWSKRETDGRREREREREAPTPVGWTRLASTTSDVATAQQSPGLPSLSTFSPSRREMGDPPRHHPPRATCRPRTPHLFQGYGSIPTSVRASVRTSVRKLAATAVTPVCIRDQLRRTYECLARVTRRVQVS